MHQPVLYTGRLGTENPTSPAYERKDCTADLLGTAQGPTFDCICWPGWSGFNCASDPLCIPCPDHVVELIDVEWD